MMDITSLKLALAIAEKEIASLKKGKKSSATQARNALSSIAKDCKNLRGEILVYQKGLPTKTKARAASVAEDTPEPPVLTAEITAVEDLPKLKPSKSKKK